MAITVVQTSAHQLTIGANTTYTPSTRPTAGNTLIIPCYGYRSDANFDPTITDNQGNTWAKVNSFTPTIPGSPESSNAAFYIAYDCLMPNAGALTVSFSQTTAGGAHVVYELDFIEIAGAATTSVLRDQAQASTSSTITSYSLATTAGLAQIGDFALGVLNLNATLANSGIVTPSGYTQIGVQQNATTGQAGQSVYKTGGVSVAGNQSVSWNFSQVIYPTAANLIVLKPLAASVKVRALIEPAFANLTGLKATIWYQPTGTDIHGANIGQYINQTSNASLDGNGNATIDINVGSTFPVASGQGVKVLITNGTLTTGIIDGLVQ